MIEFRIKEKTRSLNESFRGDWRQRAAVAKRQRAKAMQACPEWPGGPLLVVRLTRVSPGTLDEDAVPAALKHVRDGVAARLRVDDASPLVEWEYHQAKGQAEVVVQIWKWNADGDAPPLPAGKPVERRRALLPSERVSKSLRKSVAGVVVSMAKDHGKTMRAPRPAYRPPPERHPDDAAFNRAPMERLAAETVPRGSHTWHMATRAVVPSPEDAAVARAVAAAQEAFAPRACTISSPCGRCVNCIGALP